MSIDPESLLGTNHLPPQYGSVRGLSRTARAYHALSPYPSFSRMTKDWKIEERGPFPRCRPFVQHIVNKGASWLFGQQVSFRVGEEEQNADDISELINEVWTLNDMTRRSRSAAITGANSGGVVAKYSYDETKEIPVQIDLLDPTEQVRLYWNPDNIQELFMARVQYPIFNAVDGKVYWNREDYTDKTHVVYKPVAMSQVTNSAYSDPYQMVDLIDQYDNWFVAESKPNPFGVIPLWYIRNRENGTEYGEGDLWSMFETIDQINFTRNLGHKDNQKSIEPDVIYIDLTASDGDQPGTNQNVVEVLDSKDKDGKQGKVEQLQTNAALRPHLDKFADDLKNELLSAVGSIDLDQSDISNKGNLTAAVMTQIYAPLIERTNEKRQCYGEDGFCVFLERMSKGLATIGADGWQPVEDVQIVWAPFFEDTEEEKSALANRQVTLLDNCLTTHEKAVREIANCDGIKDIDDHLASVLKEKQEKCAHEAKEMEAQTSQMNRQRSSQGGVGGGQIRDNNGKFAPNKKIDA